jgi:hypothetical protein
MWDAVGGNSRRSLGKGGARLSLGAALLAILCRAAVGLGATWNGGVGVWSSAANWSGGVPDTVGEAQ